MAERRLERPLGGAVGLLAFGAAAAVAPWFVEGSTLQLAVVLITLVPILAVIQPFLPWEPVLARGAGMRNAVFCCTLAPAPAPA